MISAEIRQSFLSFFGEQGHRIVPSSSLVPINDPTLLFTNAGMNQFKDLFLRSERRDYTRATTSQKCMRVGGKHNDLRNVGPSLSHHTFFEMLGNFSFGDYFKEDAIPFAWRLLTEVWQIPPDRLYATVFKGEAGIQRDDEAYAVWQKVLPTHQIAELGIAENFWSMGDTGPCGRCSEVHYHRGSHLPCNEDPRCRRINCSCDRYVEIWNNVFMEYDRQSDGSLKPLPTPSIDTGMGLERITAVLQNKLSNYETDLFAPLLGAIGKIAGVEYRLGYFDPEPTHNVSMRVIADHMRAIAFLIADGVLPSNEWRGYVLRKIMRRAMRHGKKLSMTEPFLHRFTDVIVNEMGSAYPEVRNSRDLIVKVVHAEEERFDVVLNTGLSKFEEALEAAKAGPKVISGDTAFHFSDTFGLPLDFMDDLAESHYVSINRDEYDKAMEGQRTRSRMKSRFRTTESPSFVMNTAPGHDDLSGLPDEFVGYSKISIESNKITQLFRKDGCQTDTLAAHDTGFMLLHQTPFYLEAGGQVSDQGRIYTDGTVASVDDVIKPVPNWPRMHVVEVTQGAFRVGQLVTAEVDREKRDAIQRNHTATHLLHTALRRLLGNHVKQAGSLVAPDRLRFDFTHFERLPAEQLAEIERIVNSQVYGNHVVQTEVRSTEEAIADGATALFGENYGDRVRVVSVPGVSVELCGGTHCHATGDIGPFVITQESGVAAGVRRIEVVTGDGAVEYLSRRRAALDGILQVLSVPEYQAVGAAQRLKTDAKRLGREIERLKVKAAIGSPGDMPTEGLVDVDGVKMVTRRVSGLEKTALRELSDSLRDRLNSGVVVLASEHDGKVALVVSVTKDLMGRVHAGNVIKAIAPIIGGRGGGRPDFAEAGGRRPEKIDALFPESQAVVSRMLGKSQ